MKQDTLLSPNNQYLSAKKAGIFDPYLDTFGGGERYAMTIAEALLKKGWKVDVFWQDEKTKETLIKKFALEIERVSFVSFSPRVKNIYKRWKFERNYDLLFYFSDGSVPFMFGKKNLLHFQVPFHDVNGKKISNRLKIKLIGNFVCNSLFTKNIIEKEYGITGDVWYPPISVQEFVPALKKENYILAVGRFEKSLTEKRQDILIETFKKMVKKGLSDWKLTVAGGCSTNEDKNEIINDLRERAKGFPIEIKVNISFSELKDLYAKSKIFWHAAGYGIDEEKNPEKVEHFGMTTCCKSDTLIETKSGMREIKDILSSDFVKTHENNWKKVLELKKREASEFIYKFNDTCITKEHPVYIIRPKYKQKHVIVKHLNEYKKMWVTACDIKIGDWTIYPKDHFDDDITNKIDVTKYLTLSKHFNLNNDRIYLSVGHTDKTRHFINRNVAVDEKLGRLFGYYLAEGSIMGGHKKEHGISFSFNENETKYVNDIVELIKDIFKTNKISLRNRSNGTEILCGSKILGNLFHNLFGTGALNKRIPESFDKFGKDFVIGLLSGYIRGDGHIEKGHSIHIGTASINLAFQIKRLLTKLDIIAVVKAYSRNIRFKKLPNYNKKTTIYVINILGESGKTLIDLIKAKYVENNQRRTYNRGMQDSKYIYQRVNKIEKIFYSGYVYNLEVSGDNSYLTRDFIIHNCEAMASGCVPIVINKGGQKEIVENDKNGFLWETEDELIDFTFRIIENVRMSKVISKEAVKRSRNFSKEEFYEKIYNLIEK